MEQLEEVKKFSEFKNILDTNTKKAIFDQLKQKEEEALKNSLVQAALALHQFPSKIAQALLSLQQAYATHQQTKSVATCLVQAIQAYFNAEGYQLFKGILQQPFSKNDWSSELLIFLANTLGISFPANPLIKGTIQDGKVYWEVLRSNEVLHTPHPDFIFNEKKVWYMTWENFRIFHDSGKRSGTVEITKERFVATFAEGKRLQAGAVWEELKTKKILTEKNRLSSAWNSATNITIKLDSLIKILPEQVWEELKKHKDSQSRLNRNTFSQKWNDGYYQYIAGLIWDKLKKEKVIEKNNKVLKVRPALKKFLKTAHITYKEVIDSLYTISNNEEYQQRFEMISTEAKKYRSARDRKDWYETGKIQNVLSPLFCTRLWDVGTYSNLDSHRNTEEEKKQSANHGRLEYDHIPSTDALKRLSDVILQEYDKKKLELQNKLNDIEGKRTELLEGDTHSPAQLTKNKIRIKAKTNPSIETLESQKQEIENNLKQIAIGSSAVGEEKLGHGPRWWTIAIPEKLHQQGETYMQPTADQQNSSELFLKELICYLDILEKRYQEFSLSKEDYLKALGAFRYLYRQQTKLHEPLQQKTYSIGITPYIFFNEGATKQAIDALINQKVTTYMIRQEGVLCPSSPAP